MATAPRQENLTFEPAIIRVAVPPHAPEMARALKDSELKVLNLLQDRRTHSRRELQSECGNRYASRIEELRTAGWRILGPRRSRKHRIDELEPMRDGVECYRLTGRL